MKPPKTPTPTGRTRAHAAKTQPHTTAVHSVTDGPRTVVSYGLTGGITVTHHALNKPFPVFSQKEDDELPKTALLFVPLSSIKSGTVGKVTTYKFEGGKVFPATDGALGHVVVKNSRSPTPTIWEFAIESANDATAKTQRPLGALTLSSREEVAARAALGRLPELMRAHDQERIDDIIKASIAAAMPLQDGARAQAELLANRISEVLAKVPMLTAAEVGRNAGSNSGKIDGLAAQWSSRGQVFAVELAGQGQRYPAFQFQSDSGKPWPSLSKVLPALRAAFSPIDILIWFESPHPSIGQRSPVEVIHDEKQLQRVVDESFTPVDFW